MRTLMKAQQITFENELAAMFEGNDIAVFAGAMVAVWEPHYKTVY
jgi:hypothetical protein